MFIYLMWHIFHVVNISYRVLHDSGISGTFKQNVSSTSTEPEDTAMSDHSCIPVPYIQVNDNTIWVCYTPWLIIILIILTEHMMLIPVSYIWRQEVRNVSRSNGTVPSSSSMASSSRNRWSSKPVPSNSWMPSWAVFLKYHEWVSVLLN